MSIHANSACQLSHLLLHTAVQGSKAHFNAHALWNGLLASCECLPNFAGSLPILHLMWRGFLGCACAFCTLSMQECSLQSQGGG